MDFEKEKNEFWVLDLSTLNHSQKMSKTQEKLVQIHLTDWLIKTNIQI